MLKVAADPNLVRDPKNKAVLNTNKVGLEEYRAQREKRLVARAEQDILKQDVAEMKQTLSAILAMLQDSKKTNQ